MKHLILYDGVCGLCDRSVQFVLRRDPDGVFGFATLQGELARTILDRHGESVELTTLFAVVDHGTDDERLLRRSRAVLFALKNVRTRWRFLTVFGVLPTPLLDLGYRLVAKVRYRLFGRYDTCPVPSAEHRARFVDQ